jgi:outer membrane immunogenic protein
MKAILLGSVVASLLTVSAFGADVGVPAFKAPVATPFTWTSCYGGGQVGGGWGQKDLTDTSGFLASLGGPTAANLDTSGYMLGGQIGCDYQFASAWVLGVEGAAAGGNIGASTTVPVPLVGGGDTATFKETTNFLSSATVRAGYAWDRWLLYVKGGAAWAGDRYSLFDVAQTFDFEGLETRFGWTAGAGVEWALWNDWSVKFEYDYCGFGTRNVTFVEEISTNFGPADVKQNIQVVKLGLNFHVFAGPASTPLNW